MIRDFMLLVIAALACAALLVTNAFGVTLQVSLVQAAADVTLVFVLLVAWRVPVVLVNRRQWARECAERDAADAKKWRDQEEKRWERAALRTRRRRRRSRA